MAEDRERNKPAPVVTAIKILWAWIGFLALSGIYNAAASTRQTVAEMPPDVFIAPTTIYLFTAAGYVLVALTMVGMVLKIGRGKNWARISLLICFLADAGVSAISPHQGFIEYMIVIVNLGLQLYALVLLFAGPGGAWFRKEKK